ncbi:hypothetical protein CLV57_2995 [Mucilaginibacter auburnensis]|uniref:Uncharacterized protein n=1 Tax=Mucilaginibacter auburnensis TaxID=1457233 RepID=A0A2H9VNF2_9SPHI|nr:hypothetical protein CLV57_2995 [Mucilaginibacter auburnensis]
MASYYMFALVLYFYLITRFSVQSSFKFAGVYQLKYFLIVVLLPFAGYFIALNLLNKKLELEG